MECDRGLNFKPKKEHHFISHADTRQAPKIGLRAVVEMSRLTWLADMCEDRARRKPFLGIKRQDIQDFVRS